MKLGKLKIGTGIGAATAILLAGISIAQIAPPKAPPRPKERQPAPLPRPLPGGLQFGAALLDLDATSVQAFAKGREEFEAIETPDGGLGPIFNGRSCVECHSAGGTGGASNTRVTRFGQVVNSKFDPLTRLGGSLLQRFAINPQALEQVPREANVVAQRVTTPLFGAGLIEALSDETILLNAQRLKPEGIRGRAAMVTDVATGKTRVGRFGWKAQQAGLLAFSGDAYVNEMGITNRLFPNENAPNGNAALLARFDRVPDIEDAVDPATGKSDIDHLANFMKLLAPPPSLRLSVSAFDGSRLFEQMQCAACHTPQMQTGPNPVAALANKSVPLFSDLLLHDMGTLADGIEQGAAKGNEMRTAPLWGLRARRTFLHDGRATTVADAIRAHQGEGNTARQRFNAAGLADQQKLLDYLNSI